MSKSVETIRQFSEFKPQNKGKLSLDRETESISTEVDRTMEAILNQLFESYPDMIEIFLNGERSDHNIHHMMRVYRVCLYLTRYASDRESRLILETWQKEIVQASVAHDLYQITHLEGDKIKVHGELQALLELVKFISRTGLAAGEGSERVGREQLMHIFALITIIGNHSYADRSVYYASDLADSFDYFLSRIIADETSWQILVDRFRQAHPGHSVPTKAQVQDSPLDFCRFIPGFENYQNEVEWLMSDDASKMTNPLLDESYLAERRLLAEVVSLFFTADKLDPVADSGVESMFSIIRTFLSMWTRTEVKLYTEEFTDFDIDQELEIYKGPDGANNCHNLGRKFFEWFRFIKSAHEKLDQDNEFRLGELKRLLIYIDWAIHGLESMLKLVNNLTVWDKDSKPKQAKVNLPACVNRMYKRRQNDICRLIDSIPETEMRDTEKQELQGHFIQVLRDESLKVSQVLLTKKKDLEELPLELRKRIVQISKRALTQLAQEREFFLSILEKVAPNDRDLVERDINLFWKKVNSEISLDAEGIAFEAVRRLILDLRGFQAIASLSE